MTSSPIFVALDTPDLDTAIGLARLVLPYVGGFKLGLEFYSAQGQKGVRRMAEYGLPLFLDLKLHDIPNTVAGAIRALAELDVDFMTLHASGGAAMMRAAADAAGGKVKLLGVTVLTSLDEADLEQVGQSGPVEPQVERLALLARENGLQGVICAPSEIMRVRALAPLGFTLMVPGIRPGSAIADDQKRSLTPAEAMGAGADYVVIGRPITRAPNPAQAAAAIQVSLVT